MYLWHGPGPLYSATLKLKTVCKKEIHIKSFRHGSMAVVLDSVKLCVKSIYGYYIVIECFVKDRCSPFTGHHIGIASSNYSQLRGLRLPDDNKLNETLSVDILIGANFYWKLMGNQCIRGISGPVALNQK